MHGELQKCRNRGWEFVCKDNKRTVFVVKLKLQLKMYISFCVLNYGWSILFEIIVSIYSLEKWGEKYNLIVIIAGKSEGTNRTFWKFVKVPASNRK